jgi:hypothetical protein
MDDSSKISAAGNAPGPAIIITFDPNTQGVDVMLNADQVRCFEFGLGLLDMAKTQLDHKRRIAMVQQAKIAAENQAIAQDVMKKRLVH